MRGLVVSRQRVCRYCGDLHEVANWPHNCMPPAPQRSDLAAPYVISDQLGGINGEYHHAALRHALRADGEGDGYHHRQQLRRQADGKRHREQEGVGPRLVPHQVHHQDAGHEQQCHAHDQHAEPAGADLERRRLDALLKDDRL
jgi:hypothetical protein